MWFINLKCNTGKEDRAADVYVFVEGTDWESSFGVIFIANIIDHLPLYLFRVYYFGPVSHILKIY